MSIYMPYTYLIGWSHLGKYYYGCQYGREAKPSNLWSSYFTSSDIVSKFRQQFGEPDIVEVRKVFVTSESCVRFEQKVLSKLHKIDPFTSNSSKWLNSNVSGAILLNEQQLKDKGIRSGNTRRGRIPWNKGLTKETNDIIANQSAKMKGVPKTEEHKQSMCKPKKQSANMGRYVRSEETKAKIRISLAKTRTPEYLDQVRARAKANRRQCVFCSLESNKSNITRHERICPSRVDPS